MHLYDAIALAMLVIAAGAFALGAAALSRPDDVSAFYWLVVGIVTLRGGTQIARSGVRG